MGINLRRGTAKVRKQESKLEKKAVPKGKKDDGSISLNNCTICITGTIPGKTRAQAFKSLKAMYKGLTLAQSVTSTVDYLVTGHGVGQRKLAAAESKGVPIIEWKDVY